MGDKFENHDLFLALIAPTGTDLEPVVTCLKDQLQSVNYDLEVIRLSSGLPKPPAGSDEFDRIKHLMDAGDELRKQHGHDAVLKLALNEVIEKRNAKKDTSRGTAYLFRSLKTPQEVYSLRELYGKPFYAISAFSAKERRIKNLTERFSTRDTKDTDANYLSTRDETDSEKSNGQNVRDTFPLADLFLNVDKLGPAKEQVHRFVELIFGNTFNTPTKEEYGMFIAQGAALRSADLGRQVGAAIASPDGDILSIGTNEVPLFGGGQFWPDYQGPDPRDYVRDEDWNSKKLKELVRDLLKRIGSGAESPVKLDHSQIEALMQDIFSESPPKHLKGAEILSVIGFYRSTHAETSAIVDAARRGVSIRNSHLFATAFPCQECARHILTAGIKRVFYIEPYPKSLAEEQYPDSIVVTSSGSPADKLSFEPFVGIAPRQYMWVFAKNKRKKKDGTVLRWIPTEARLRYGRPIDFFQKVEQQWAEQTKAQAK
ncbi:MAG: hypothetical protein K2X27_20420 [Candidatus Obscuribacterales bacterium]|nr:hypothetical protein [Candidatus Obscuribacterales bacterium]